MQIGIGVRGDVERVRLAEELGYAMIGCGDSQSISPDTYVSLTVMALNSERVLLSPMTTNPVTRHPTVTAGAIASINKVSNGRAILGFGRGNNAPKNIGQKRANTVFMREYITTLQALMRGENVMYQGHDIHTRWITEPVPIYLSAYGPITMRMAGELADGVIICCGIHPEIIADNIALVHEGARAAGRNPDDIVIWVMTRGSVRDTHQEAVDDVKSNIASGGLMIPLDDHVPEELLPAINDLRRNYVYREHVVHDGPNPAMIDDLGLTDYLIDRLSIAGTPEECQAKLKALDGLPIDLLYFAGAIRDPLNMTRRLAEEVCADYMVR
jgi:5,10-methylenetetrahydromethanopterin reductase